VFDRILIANRGEIACRIIDTARRLGIRTVAVYSEADADALHVRLADEAYPIGGAAAADSYLRVETIVEVARHSGAQAVHPGYGFLSENPALAEACAAADIAFVGPPADAIRAMGAKDQARRIMEEAEVPIVPGYHDDNLDLKVMTTQARLIGFPVMVKAVAGGGGRGIRIAARELDLAEAIAAARREAKSAFGDDRVLIEKLVVRPRHIEVQIFTDTRGNAVHMYERDCSVQRRHQKVIEEAPSPAVSPGLRAELGATAVAAAQAIGYVGAGTVEFIVDPEGTYYFLEMNTRLQVEHPVTEMITGLDLVEWQLRVAAGEALPLPQESIPLYGHAVEVRLYAEDPARDFLPVTGTLSRLRLPVEPGSTPAGARVSARVDCGVVEGDSISPHYDPMIAKLISWGRDRAEAVRALSAALSATQIGGTTTNLAFLGAILRHPAYGMNEVDTGFIERHSDDLLPPPTPAPALALALAVLSVLLERRQAAVARTASSADPHSPWGTADGWRLNDDAHDTITVIDNGEPVEIGVRGGPSPLWLDLPDGEVEADGTLGEDGRLRATVAGIAVNATTFREALPRGGEQITVSVQESTWHLGLDDPLAVAAADEADSGRLTAPMPGRIVRVLADDGAKVERGAPLMILEAMKMEHTIAAPAAGRVERFKFALGDWVSEGEVLVDFVADEAG
jgi:3-methylcrotonyl-CoA carboxylase alpha subunit